MQWLEKKYINLLSGRLEKFTRINNNTFRFRCPICGDSQTNKSKTRGYVYTKKGSLKYHCHNCGISMGFPFFLRSVDQNLYYEFMKDKIVESGGSKPEEEQKPTISFTPPKFLKESPLKKLKKVSQLKIDHPVKLYVQKRGIPSNLHYKLFYTPKFRSWVNSIIPEKLPESEADEPRLIIPFLDKEGNLFGFQGRAFSKKSIRYITIMMDEDKPKIFGLDTVNPEDTVYVVEGPIDSMFIPNCVASAGSDITSNLTYITPDKDKFVIVYDNEPRNKDTVKKIYKSIENGYKVVIWPDIISQKDINDMVLDGINVLDVIQQNTYSGLEAKLTLSNWKKL